MRKSAGFFLGVGACVLVLGGCEATKQTLGINVKTAPDEFAVYSRAALSVPPDFSLRPPTPGASRPQDVEPRRQAERAVTGAAGRAARTQAQAQAQARTAGASAGLQAILKQTGALDADTGIRGLVDRETTQMAERDRSIADRILFWQEPASKDAEVVDAGREAQRIRGTQALGRPITEGQSPTIERRKKGLLEGIF